MPNIQDHAIAVGQQPLSQRPFDQLDALILTQLVYMPMEGKLDQGQRCTVGESWAFLKDNVDPDQLDQFQQKRYRLTEVCAEQPRYRDWLIHDYVNHVDDELVTQFCAAVYDLEDGTCCISFRGTDLTMAGWKEDFNMSYMVVPAQKETVEYVEHIAANQPGGLRLCGHSKGGNLSIYGAAYVSPPVQQRVLNAYSFDGPGMFEEIMASREYKQIESRISSFIPQSSVVGMLMNYHPVYTVVQARSAGILQHDAMTWQVENGNFVCLEGLDMSGRITDETLHTWLATMDLEDRRTLVNTVYKVVDAAQAELVTDLAEDWRDTAVKVLEAIREMDPELKKNVRIMLHSLFSTGASEVIRSILPNAASNGQTLLKRVVQRVEDEFKPKPKPEDELPDGGR